MKSFRSKPGAKKITVPSNFHEVLAKAFEMRQREMDTWRCPEDEYRSKTYLREIGDVGDA